jgi:predicted metal-dependent RNase
MGIRLHFWGAAQTVTGSSHHLECAGQNVLLDCGLFQGHRQQAREINEHLALPVEQLNALSHAHIDHSGDLPLLAKKGYRGPIYTMPSTPDLCEKMLKDSAHIQESDAEFVNKRVHRRKSIGVALDGEAVVTSPIMLPFWKHIVAATTADNSLAANGVLFTRFTTGTIMLPKVRLDACGESPSGECSLLHP